ncbi:hypothetical protein PVAND_010109 [Polypedilum vanderplanki]|uniref:Chromo domain-containing protein n=1 Tax=Polypedilum vanderplanki TaxID=319348 RepID=A0A9J6CFC7_POLVA|nr:hypothetical protein PVAND_010109 [Polypedilum vanderplanki]
MEFLNSGIMGKRKRSKKETYEVESIVNKRTTDDGKIEYFLKWRNYSDDDNTWEPIENLNCPDLIEDYEKNMNEKKRKVVFENGMIPEKIVNVTNTGKNIKYMIKFKDTEKCSIIPSAEVRQICPELLVDFLLEHVEWCENNDKWILKLPNSKMNE